ncbi:Uncharacterized conserved protein, DUF849 family [Cribrihabitans marinus]|uniref:Uncharacterized conserved protein, DUF849 family n=1 Tax=Cribrihabitans marinus TaxID=1227549 RepID=A0A1H6YZ68_9RHOB|nr:3-keto-5-aminohexanoate cleavage protein [Cribrihabitans marinus]GGH29466.1 3-keto-5-aminohexanoate cleavage protein [Cribrihabitans marinus]SEJ42005.1 Uncharacterized conserved protein, DUF849 family [Cribrihabitans marinus]
MRPLPRIMVAPNGARRQKSDHPALPVTLNEMLETAAACHAAGADGLHLHLRDADGGHLLDVDSYRTALRALADAVPDLAVQITTEAVGIYAPEVQRRVALGTGADMVSVAIREMCRDPQDVARAFYADCAARGIAVQHILYDLADADLLAGVIGDEALRDQALQLIYVLGRYSKNQTSEPSDLDPFLAWLQERKLSPDWAICAFGPGETDCLLRAARHGGKCRIGFENSLWNRDGSLARDNAERVSELVALLGDGADQSSRTA